MKFSVDPTIAAGYALRASAARGAVQETQNRLTVARQKRTGLTQVARELMRTKGSSRNFAAPSLPSEDLYYLHPADLARFKEVDAEIPALAHAYDEAQRAATLPNAIGQHVANYIKTETGR